ncbi:TGF-beta receptor type-1-like isoform X2 [Argiope bruennichi]|uniref:TGF-beta receptor type-1-like isoform X2 n=1 Tax=Argiope bruennichi TaxID=94029 RepID=UPI002494E75F|nr:TGF-beta receptor type-1-like isoform X2 [Argiope bruennichi]
MDMVIDEMRKAFRKRPPILKCECNVCEESQNNTCITDGLCYTEIHGKNGEISYTYGCLNRQQFLPPEDIPFVCRDQKYGVQCCFHDYCNRDLLPALPTENEKYEVTLGGYETSLIAFSCVVVLMLVFIFFFCIRYQKEKLRRNCRSDIEANHENRIPLMDTRISELRNCTTSGSGSGVPLLVQRSIARKVTLVECVGKGRYGEVWKGSYYCDFCAVKIFSTRDDKSWEREVEVYETVMLRHENILGFIAADRKDNGTWTQLWLVTDYHPNGSLFDYLSKTTVDVATMYTMALSIANGLAHLHLEILGTQGKPAIAHRDLKSKNILVKRDGTCAIADLGMAVRYDSSTCTVDIAPNPRVGTVRYLAPEVLDNTINLNQFDSFKRVDIYAYGLVLWEIARRCNVDGIYEEYQLPYYDMVPSDPSVEEMRKVICDAKLRPPCPNRWQSQESLRVMSKIMKECWYQNAAARLTALRIKKTLAALGVQKDMKI